MYRNKKTPVVYKRALNYILVFFNALAMANAKIKTPI